MEVSSKINEQIGDWKEDFARNQPRSLKN